MKGDFPLKQKEQWIQSVLKELAQGKTREEVAQQLHHKSRASMDQRMRRYGYVWDPPHNTYVPKGQRTLQRHSVSSKAAEAVALLSQPSQDPASVAKKLGFGNPNELGQFMARNGFLWSHEAGNFVRTKAATEAPSQGQEQLAAVGIPPLGNVYEILSLLYQHEDKVRQLFDQTLPEHTMLPRYLIPGPNVVKSLHLTLGMNDLLKQFSVDKNVSQKEIVEIALVDFFKHHGYGSLVDRLLENS